MGIFWKTYKDQVKFDRYIMPGLTPRSLKHHYSVTQKHIINLPECTLYLDFNHYSTSLIFTLENDGPLFQLIPIHLCTVVGFLWAGYCSWRTLVYNPDSQLMRRDNYERYRDGRDYLVTMIYSLCPILCFQ